MKPINKMNDYFISSFDIGEDKHGIGIFSPEENGGERDMTLVFNSIKRFINPNDQDDFPPLFCQEEDIELTRGCLYWLASRASKFFCVVVIFVGLTVSASKSSQ